MLLKKGNGHKARSNPSKSGKDRRPGGHAAKPGKAAKQPARGLRKGNGHKVSAPPRNGNKLGKHAKPLKNGNGHKPSTSRKNGNGHHIEPRPLRGRGYMPSEREPFMNERQRQYFRKKLMAWRDEILADSKDTLDALQAECHNHPDYADRASSETDRSIELRARDRQRKLICKIHAALKRIEDGSYGYCEETGEPISLKRLVARPIATLSVEAQERHERRERVYRDE
jgi:DnaK suppressor protein